MQWSDAQRAAIASRGSNLLVSAAAGSGKTAVLAARILALVQEGVGIDEMLVVTFTRAAAAEMRARILTLLHDAAEAGDRRMATQAMRVERADITTLHGFCGGICRGYFHAAGVDPTFRVAESAEAGVLRAQAMQDALIACFESPTPAFSYASECLSRVELIDAVDQLHRFLSARPDPWQWLTEAIAAHHAPDETLRGSAWVRVLLDKIRFAAGISIDAYRQAEAFAAEIGRYQGFSACELAYAVAWRKAAEAGLDAMVAFDHPPPGRKPNKPRDANPAEEAAYMALRDSGKKALKDAMETVENLGRMLARKDDLTVAGVLLQGVADACRAFSDRYALAKEEKNLLDFSDLEHCALRALRVPEVSAAVREKYQYIFIDEYQDSSHLQEAIVALVKRPDNLFMVGDIKQSIYRFRLAEPGLFLDKLRSFSAKAGSRDLRVALNENYRSHKMLINGINTIFERLFCGGTMELAYDEAERLVPGKLHPWPGAPVELHAIVDGAGDAEADDPPSAGDLTPEVRKAVELEAEIIAQRIIELRNAPEGGYALRDMVVLMRAVRGKAAYVVDTLRAQGIDAWTDAGGDTLEKTEVQAILSLLRVLDNLRQDIPLMAVLRGPALGLGDASLAEIRVSFPDGSFHEAVLAYSGGNNDLARALFRFIERIREWATDSQVLPLDSMIRRIYNETGYYAAVGALRDGAARQANLRMLAEHAGRYQRAQSGGLSGFLRYIDRVSEGEGLALPEIGEADDVVRVMSIHKSKGLQFPVVFIAGLGTRFRLKDSAPLQVHAELGASMPTIRPALRTKWTALAREAIAEKRRQEALAEEARLLYVAMTRAQNRLVLVGTAKPSDPERWANTLSTAVQSASSFMDWVGPCATACDGWNLRFHDCLARDSATLVTSNAGLLVQGLYRHEPVGETIEVLSWKTPECGKRPLKQSVTALTKRLKDPEAYEHASISGQPKRPLFMERRGLTAAERGDAIHAFLATVDIHARDWAEASQAMVREGKLSSEQAAALPMHQLTPICGGALWGRMRAAQKVFRELPFNVRMQETGTRSLLQGVIDCCFLEDGQWVVVDYKSDATGDAEALAARYAPQVERYAEAVTAITGRPVKEKVLYLIETGICISL